MCNGLDVFPAPGEQTDLEETQEGYETVCLPSSVSSDLQKNF